MGGFVRCEFVAERVPDGCVDRAAGRRRARVRRRALSRRHRPDARARLRALIGATTVRRMGAELLFVTQVAPYRRRTRGRARGARPGRRRRRADRGAAWSARATRSPTCARLEPEVLASARALALFTIGETPWAVEQRGAILDGVRSGRPRGRVDPLGHGLVLRLGRVRLARRRAVRRPPLDADLRGRRVRSRASRLHASRSGVELARRGVPVPGSAPGCAGAPPRARRRARPRRQPARARRRSAIHSRGASPKARVASSPPALGHFPSAWETPAYLSHLAGGLGWALDA